MLLPEAVHFGANVNAYVAEDIAGDPIVGAIAISREVRTSPVTGASIAMHVVPPHAGRGVEQLLLSAAEETVRARGLAALYTWGALESGSANHVYWRGLGFDGADEVMEGRTDVAVGLRYLDPFWRELVDRGRVPADLRVGPLDTVDPTAIARLYVAHIGGSFEKILAEIRGEAPRSFDPTVSPVILAGGEIAAFVLGRRLDHGFGHVEAIIVDTPFRGRWANVMVKREGWRACVETGIHTVVYYTHGKHKDTRRFTEKVGTTLRPFVEPYRMLARGPANASRAG